MRTISNLKKMVVLLVLAIVLPVQTYAMNEPTLPKEDPKTEAYAAKLIERLEEIKAMDKSNMTRAEKKALRSEVKGIKKELATAGGGVYLSVGAIIIIILLLILIL